MTDFPARSGVVSGCFWSREQDRPTSRSLARHSKVHANQSQRSMCSCPYRPVVTLEEDRSTLLVYTRCLSGFRIDSPDTSRHRCQSMVLHRVACRLDYYLSGCNIGIRMQKNCSLLTMRERLSLLLLSRNIGNQAGKSGPAT